MKILKFFLRLLVIIIGFLLIIIIVLPLHLLNIYFSININYYSARKLYSEEYDVEGNKNKYIPQGLTYSEDYNVILQTSYNKNHEVSKLYVTDFKTGVLLKELKLINIDGTENTDHVGGIATYKNRIWITSDYRVNEFNLDEIMNTTEKSIKSISKTDLPIRGDFCTFNENTLWIGDFFLKHFYDVPNNTPYLYGYTINDSNTDLIINYQKPDKTYILPKAVQGMVINGNDFYFTESFTYLNRSKLEIYHNVSDSKNLNEQKNKTKKILPPMAEGMFLKDNKLYILFESSADAYSPAQPKLSRIQTIDLENIDKLKDSNI